MFYDGCPARGSTPCGDRGYERHPLARTTDTMEGISMAFAPIQIFTFGFPDQSRLEGRIADELLK